MEKIDIDDLLDITDDSDSSSDPGTFENKPFVLELHDIKKDEPATDTVTPVTKVKKKRKRSQQPTDVQSGSTSSVSALSDSVPRLADGTEEFYDADGSFHEVKEAKVKPSSGITPGQGQGPKTVPNGTTQTQRSSNVPDGSTNTIKKPVVQPE